VFDKIYIFEGKCLIIVIFLISDKLIAFFDIFFQVVFDFIVYSVSFYLGFVPLLL